MPPLVYCSAFFSLRFERGWPRGGALACGGSVEPQLQRHAKRSWRVHLPPPSTMRYPPPHFGGPGLTGGGGPPLSKKCPKPMGVIIKVVKNGSMRPTCGGCRSSFRPFRSEFRAGTARISCVLALVEHFGAGEVAGPNAAQTTTPTAPSWDQAPTGAPRHALWPGAGGAVTCVWCDWNDTIGGSPCPNYKGTPPRFEKCSKLTGTISFRVVGRSRGVNVVVAHKIIRPVSAWHARNFTMNLVLRGPKRHS